MRIRQLYSAVRITAVCMLCLVVAKTLKVG